MIAFADRSTREHGQALEVVMGALQIPRYPPVAGFIRQRIAASIDALPPQSGLEALRAGLAALSPAQFDSAFRASLNPLADAEEFGLVAFGPMGGLLAAWGRSLCETRALDERHLRHFTRVEGLADNEAVRMARFFEQLLEHLGEPERTELEESVIGQPSRRVPSERWRKLITRHPPLWLRE